MYELACVLKNDFALEHVFCSQQHNFLFQLVRRGSTIPRQTGRLLVHTEVLTESIRRLVESVFPESAITWIDSTDLPNSQIEAHDLILSIMAPISTEELKKLRHHYELSGVAALTRGPSRVLDYCLLAERSMARDLTMGLVWSKSDAFRTIMEYNLILRGVPLLSDRIELK